MYRVPETIRLSACLVVVLCCCRITEQRAFAVLLDVAKWDTVSGWRDHFLVMPLGEMCFVYEDIMPGNIQTIVGLKKLGQVVKCPIVNGIYLTTNIPTQLAPLRHFPALPYGRHRVYLITKYAKPENKNKDIRSCVKAVVDIIQKV